MKESPAPAHEQANDYINQLEDQFVCFLMATADELKQRAESSNTTIAWNEYNSAQQRLDDELDRLYPPDWRLND